MTRYPQAQPKAVLVNPKRCTVIYFSPARGREVIAWADKVPMADLRLMPARVRQEIRAAIDYSKRKFGGAP